ncbi:dCTP deaminase, partial [Haliangium sp. UPWRP_2]|uniref:dCTP deaminase n=1 Tax=Haliangium sp. UPWRP_2 TaxID=1931276 RepID=UPI000D0CA879
MTALSGPEIRNRLQAGDIKQRLVVSPLLAPEEQLRDDQAAIDVRLGFEFALVSASSHGMIDEFAPDSDLPHALDLAALYRKQYVALGNGLVIHPHQFILAVTLEYLRLPNDLMAYVIGRSTWGRLGLIVATAAGVHPGYAGSLTLELRNLGETPLKLYPGQTIAQLFFHIVDVKEKASIPGGQYTGRVDIIPKKISSSATREKILGIKSRN